MDALHEMAVARDLMREAIDRLEDIEQRLADARENMAQPDGVTPSAADFVMTFESKVSETLDWLRAHVMARL